MAKAELFSLGAEKDTLNRKLGGGLPKSSVVWIEGQYGAGKSVFAQRFTWGLVEQGYSVAYLTPELDFEGFMRQMNSLEYDITEALLNFRLMFLEVPLKSGQRYADTLIESDIIWKSDITIIDSFDQLLRNDAEFDSLFKSGGDEEKIISQRLISFFRNEIKKDKTIVLLADPSNLSEQALDPFRSVADVFFNLRMIEVGGDTRRNLEIKRFSGMGENVGGSIGYSVKPGQGLTVESREVV